MSEKSQWFLAGANGGPREQSARNFLGLRAPFASSDGRRPVERVLSTTREVRWSEASCKGRMEHKIYGKAYRIPFQECYLSCYSRF